MCKPVSGSTSALPLVVHDPQYIGNIGMLELAAVLARLGLCSVLLCGMEWTALGLERLQSPPFDLYATIRQYLSSASSLVAILGHYLSNC